MKNRGKLVSIIIPTYRRPDTLGRAIESVLNQTYCNIEVIVVDDNGDNTEGRNKTELFMTQYADDSRIKYVKHQYNKNGSAARNTGFRTSLGEYIMFLDDDDEFLPRKVEAQISCLEGRDTSWGVCYTKNIQKKDGRIVKKSTENREGTPLADALGRNFFIAAGSNLMVRREVFDAVCGFDESFLRNQDQEFLVKILKLYKIAFVNEVGLIIHLHQQIAQQMSFDDITIIYLDRFRDTIESLDDKTKDRIYKLLNLQRFRAKIIRERDVKSAFNMIVNKEVGICIVLRYFTHLFYRSITHKSMGFHL